MARPNMNFLQAIVPGLSLEEIEELRAMLRPELRAMVEANPPKIDRIKSSDNSSHKQWFRN